MSDPDAMKAPVVVGVLAAATFAADEDNDSIAESNESESTAASSRSAGEIGKALTQARRESRRLQLRVKLPALLIGSVLVGGVSIEGVAQHSLWFVYLPWTAKSAAKMLVCDIAGSLGCIAWLIHCLPTDRWSPKVGCALLFVLGATCAWRITGYAVKYFVKQARGEACAIEGEQTDCQLVALASLAQAALHYAIHLWQLPYLARGMCLPSRMTISRLWVALALLHFANGAGDVAIPPAVAIRALHGGGEPWGAILFSTLHGVYAFSVGFLLQSTKFRQWVHFTLLSKSGALTVSSSIAAFIGHRSSKSIMTSAEEACRFVSLDRVRREDMLLSSPEPGLQSLSTRCRLQDIDAFLTHSWHDEAEPKWEALQAWRAKFKQQSGREPRLWIDKYCIDQNNIDESLVCLPVFLAGCHTLLIIAGPTYLSRLWCVEEIFVYLKMGRPAAGMELYCLDPALGEQISKFDVHDTQCSKEVDRQTLLATIEAGCDSFEAFNSQVRQVLERVHRGAALV